MRRTGWLVILLLGLLVLPASSGSAQSSGNRPPVHISGVVQSFSGNTLDVKPATSPSVWVTVPADLHVDRDAVKPGVEVSVDAYWADLCYIATQVSVQKK